MNNPPYVLTFGVELEFIACYNPEDYQDKLQAAEGKFWPVKSTSWSRREKYGNLVSRHMVQILNENGFCTNNYQRKGFLKWTVDTDSTITPFDISGNWYAIEVKTPVLYFCRAALEHVQRAVTLLVSKFKLYTNENCGLHVHVGNEDRGFTMGTLKHFCSLITVFEHQLDSLHPPARLKNPHVKSMRKAFSPEATLVEKLSIIDKLEAVNDLIHKLHFTEYADNDRNMAYNLFNLLENAHDRPLRTIEFRQHRGTLDPQLITNWVKVACNLVKVSYSGRDILRDLIRTHLNHTEYTVIDLFKDLNLSDLAEFYAPLVFPQHQTSPVADDSIEDEEEPGVIKISSPGKFDTGWERQFAPRPPSETEPYKQSAFPDS
ncbi:hypothetical protein MMC29_004882 [Sticta canariensis]|nr:hypothetical protein [Sticta canariensis]